MVLIVAIAGLALATVAAFNSAKLADEKLLTTRSDAFRQQANVLIAAFRGALMMLDAVRASRAGGSLVPLRIGH